MDEVLLIAVHVLGLMVGAYCMWIYMGRKVDAALKLGLESHKIAEGAIKLAKEAAGMPVEPEEVKLKNNDQVLLVNVFKGSGRWN